MGNSTKDSLPTGDVLAFKGSPSETVSFELAVYRSATKLSGDYKGGEWQYTPMPKGGVFFAPVSDRKFEITGENGERFQINASSLGLLATTLTIKSLIVNPRYGHLKTKLSGLFSAIKNHSESDALVSAYGLSQAHG